MGTLTIEEALDFFRAEGGWEPVIGAKQVVASAPVTVTSPHFFNQCLKCLEWRQASKVELGYGSKIWLCEQCLKAE
jgi:hypothetical protein